MTDISIIQSKIELDFRQKVQKDKKLKNAYLLVYSKKLGINLNIAEGKTDDMPANPKQANHLASVGKIFTSTIIGMLYDKNLLNFDDKISKFLDSDLVSNLHIYKGVDYSNEISVKQLLQQTSGLNDVFFPLLKEMINNPELKLSVREAIEWGKENAKPIGKPGQKHFYNDTNYYLLGLIIESITQKPFHQVVHEMIFSPLKMDNSYINGYSEPKNKAEHPPANIFIDNENFIDNERIAKIDYAGGGVVAPLNEYLIFMKALVNNELVKKETLNTMIYDDVKMGFPVLGFNYGYSIWKPRAIPLLMPKELFCWGCVGVTGAFMFFHPKTESYIIGTFNDKLYASKALRFMLMNIVKPLVNIKK